MRTVEGKRDTLNWVLSDHLGSTSVTANADGTWNSTIQYTAFGEIRALNGVTITKYRYTGQLAQDVLGLDYYVARWYDPVTARFISGDKTIPLPFMVNSYDRFSYVTNSPIMYIDPSGYRKCDGEFSGSEICDTVTRKSIKQVISITFGWNTDDVESEIQLDNILSAGVQIAKYVGKNLISDGFEWIKSQSGNIRFHDNGRNLDFTQF